MARRPLALFLALLAGCGGLLVDPSREPGPEPAIDLAERLPPELGRCVVARVDHVPNERRRAFGEVTEAGPLAFVPGAPIAAVAVASERPGRAVPSVALYRTTAEEPAVRRFFASRSGARIAFEDGLLCDDDDLCLPVEIDFVEPTLMRIGLGAPGSRGPAARGAGAEGGGRCATLLRADPSAVEVAAWDAGPVAPGSRITSPIASTWRVEPSRDGLAVSRVDRYADPRFAATAARLETALPPEPGWILAADRQTRVAVEREVRFAAALTFRDLALGAQDEDRLRLAMEAETALAWQLVPADAIDVRRYEVVDRQVYVRRERLKGASGPSEAELARELVALVDRAIEVHPEQERLAEVRFEVLLDVLGDAPAAAQAAEAALGAHPDDRAAWHARRREALLRFDPDAAAASIEEAGVVEEGRGRDAIAALRALLEAGLPAAGVRKSARYAVAEAAVALAERVEREPGPTSLAEPLVLAWHALPETAVALFEVRRQMARADRLLVVLRESARAAEPSVPFIELARRDGGPRRMAVVSTDARGALRAFGRALRGALGDGAVTLTFAVVPDAGAPRTAPATMTFVGRATERGLRVEAAYGPVSDWARVVRLVTEPLARMHPFRRPAPAFAVELASAEERRILRDRLGGRGEIACGDAAFGLACRSSLSGSALRRAWVDAAGPLLGR